LQKLDKRAKQRGQVQMLCIDDLVPQEHIVREIDAAIDLSFIYDEVKDLYSPDFGRPSIDPVVLFKIPMLQYLFGIRTMRQTIKEIEVNVSYRWYLGLDFHEAVPHFTTFGKNYMRRFAGTDIFERIFARILQEAVDAGFVDASAVIMDATHIKASANKQKAVSKEVELQAKQYQKQLDEEIERDRLAHGKKPLKSKDDDDSVSPTKHTKQSTTDPECGLFHKGEHKVEFAYTSHAVCDKHGFILDCDISPGNVHDSVMFDGLYDRVSRKFTEISAVALDAGYKTPWIMKQIFDSQKFPCAPYKRPMTKAGFFRKYEYVYDEYYDCYICPHNQVLKYSTTNRDGYREYKSDPKVCVNCPSRHQCTESKNRQKVVTRHVWEGYMELAEDVRHSDYGKQIYSMRGQTIERVFGDAKEKHFMRYTQYRGNCRLSQQVTKGDGCGSQKWARLKMQVLLTFACMNLKKMAKWKTINGLLDDFSSFGSWILGWNAIRGRLAAA
jgi:transposase